jgi:hypothetical protein
MSSSSGVPWPEAFLGVSVALGESLDASLEALDPAVKEQASEFLEALRSPSRDVRKRGIARAVAAVIVGLDEMRVR